MKKGFLTPVLMSAVLLLVGCSSSKKKEEMKQEKMDPVAALEAPVTQEAVNYQTAQWPQASKAAVNALTEKYGLPSAVTEEMAVWEDSKPFKRSIVYREQVDHQFPMQHSDILMQTVNYRVPLDKIERVSKFNGSLIIDRTKGELSSRNEKEEMNILALNLADKIVRGELTVEQARREYSKDAEAFAAGTTSELITSLKIDDQGNTSDPDSQMQSQEARSPAPQSGSDSEYESDFGSESETKKTKIQTDDVDITIE